MKKDDSNLFHLPKKVKEADKLPVRLERDSLDWIKWNQTKKTIMSTLLLMYNAECNKLMSIK